MKKIFLFAICAALLASCASKGSYTITGEVDPSHDGEWAYLYDYYDFYSGPIDSTEIVGGKFRFRDAIAGGSLRCVVVDHKYVEVIVEGDDLTVDMETHNVVGSPLNEAKKAFDVQYDSLRPLAYNLPLEYSLLSEAEFDEKVNALIAELNAALGEVVRPILKANDNALGAYVFWRWTSGLETPEEFDEAVALVGPYVRNFGPVKKVIEKNDALKKTAEGMPFVDFTIEHGNHDGSAAKLSDYVGRGKYVLVDFWASWCGPCRREIPYLREVWEKYRGEKFEVLGIAVWDEREKTLEAAEQLGIAWPEIIDAQSVPTELYGIDGIPHIILFAPDGTIVARGLRGEALKAKVAEVLAE